MKNPYEVYGFEYTPWKSLKATTFFNGGEAFCMMINPNL